MPAERLSSLSETRTAELVLPFWLVFNGFQPQPYQGQPITPPAA